MSELKKIILFRDWLNELTQTTEEAAFTMEKNKNLEQALEYRKQGELIQHILNKFDHIMFPKEEKSNE
jgi:hypothetical protein